MLQNVMLIALLISLVTELVIGGTITVVLQTGRTLRDVNGSMVFYNRTYETSISTQYIDSWNYQQGTSYYWGQSDYTVCANSSSGTFRLLMNFNKINSFVPVNAVVLNATLTLTFVNWGNATSVEGCYLKPSSTWSPFAPPTRYKGTGWTYRMYNGSGVGMPWNTPGGWGDCQNTTLIKFGNIAPDSGTQIKTVLLDPAVVQSWITNPTGNNGMLFRETNGRCVSIKASNETGAPGYRPSLAITYSTDPGAVRPPPGSNVGSTVGSTFWADDAAGDDVTGSGQAQYPFKSLRKALIEAYSGDVVMLKSGVYAGGVQISRPGITLQSAPGQWAVVASPTNTPNIANVIQLRPGANYGAIRNLEIVGGFHYGIMFWTWQSAPSHWLIENVRVHDTGSSNLKMAPQYGGVQNVTIRKSEFYNAGARARTYGHGVEAVGAGSVTIQDCYIHDVPGAGVHLAGGTSNSFVERTAIYNTTFGINLGFQTAAEYFNTAQNPKLYESRNTTVRNTIIAATRMAGINLWAAENAAIYHNTIWGVQQVGQSAILINSVQHADAAGAPIIGCSNVDIRNNILAKSAAARAGPVVQIRADWGAAGPGLDPASALIMSNNIYYDAKGAAGATFQWGVGAMLEDERPASRFVGNVTGWKAQCAATRQQCDPASVEADPKLDGSFAPVGCSPAVGKGAAIAAVREDYNGRPRSASAPAIGAIEPGSSPAKPWPPTFAFSSTAPYTGAGKPKVYDRGWPYDAWAAGSCADVLVDAAAGTDSQTGQPPFAKPFKTIGAALQAVASKQCNRILLKGGQTHAGPIGIYRPNVTIATNPADSSRALLQCPATTATKPCIIMGEGDMDGAGHVTLKNFNVQMMDGASGPCLQLNEGQGGGSSSGYWNYWVAARGVQGYRPYTLIEDMKLIGCGSHGIKFSTFINDVLVSRVEVAGSFAPSIPGVSNGTASMPKSPGGNGIEARNGNNIVIRDCYIHDVRGTGIVLGGGAANNTVERNLIANFGDRGVLLGSDNTEPSYMNRASASNAWYDNIGNVVRNNVIMNGIGAGIAFYSAKDALVAHNTLYNVAAKWHAGVIFNVSPKTVWPGREVAASNKNITFVNNVVVLAPGSTLPMVEMRTQQASMASPAGYVASAAAACSSAGRRLQQGHPTLVEGPSVHAAADAASSTGSYRRMLQQESTTASVPDTKHAATDDVSAAASLPTDGATGTAAGSIAALAAAAAGGTAPWAVAAANLPGTAGRSSDGSCQILPPSSPWHQDISSAPVHPNSASIITHIGLGGRLHADFAGSGGSGAQMILYGIPFHVVDTSKGQAKVPVNFTAYPAESDPGPYPIPANASIEGAYPGCPPATCPGDRHVIVLDNATCLLYETWESVAPRPGSLTWSASNGAVFNMSSNKLRPYGWTSADAAGLPIYPGLVKYNDVVVKGLIDHAIRMTGPNSRAAYQPPATHFAAAGDKDPDAPWMGMRLRLNKTYNCDALSQHARVVCVALQTYGAIFADNGSPWYLSGEATSRWSSVASALVQDISKIPGSAFEVVDMGCICLDRACSVYDCGGQTGSTMPMYAAVPSPTEVVMQGNVYHRREGAARFINRLVPGGYDGGFAGWASYIREAGSKETDPKLAPANLSPAAGGPAAAAAAAAAAVTDDFFGRPRAGAGAVGAVPAGSTAALVKP